MDNPADTLTAAGWTLHLDTLWQPPGTTRRHTLAVAALLLRPVAPGAAPGVLFAPKKRGRPRTRWPEK